MRKNLTPLILWVLASILIGLIFQFGYLTCKWTYTKDPIIDYTPIDPVQGSFDKDDLIPVSEDLEPQIIYRWVYVDRPEKPQETPVDVDNIGRSNYPQPGPKIDSLESFRATIRDWNTARTYSEIMFDRQDLGRLDIKVGVQYNTISSLTYSYEPVQKTVTYPPRQRVVQPFIRASYTSLNQAAIGGGLYIKKVGVDVFYVCDGGQNKSGVGVGMSYRF